MFLRKRKRSFRVSALLIAFITAFSSSGYHTLMQVQAAGTEEVSQEAAKLVTYPAPDQAALNDAYFSVKVRPKGAKEWQSLAVYKVRVQNTNTSDASYVYFDCNGPVEVSVTSRKGNITSAAVNPSRRAITPAVNGSEMTFEIPGPTKLSVEIDGDISHNLHLFANPLEGTDYEVPDKNGTGVRVVHAGDPVQTTYEEDIIYVEPGYYTQDFRLKDNQTLYLAGGAMVHGCVRLDSTTNARLIGRGVLDSPPYRAISVDCAVGTEVAGVIVRNYGSDNNGGCFINIGNSRDITVRNAKGFGQGRWTDGIDVFTSENVTIEDCFIRSGDDCIAIYGPRINGGHLYWGEDGNVKGMDVSDCILMPDLAHPINIATHGDPTAPGGGCSIDSLSFRGLDILIYNKNAINLSPISMRIAEGNKLTNTYFEDIRIQDSMTKQICQIQNEGRSAYGAGAGRGVENLYLKDVVYMSMGDGTVNKSPIIGLDENGMIKDVTFENLVVNEKLVTDANREDFFDINEYTENIRFVKSGEARYEKIEIPERVWPKYCNLALGKTASASSAAVGHPASGANDGSEDTAWTAGSGSAGQWWMVDLGEIRKITGGMRITWDKDGIFHNYTVEASTDGKKWNGILDKSDNVDAHQIQWDHFVQQDVNARYLKITVDSPDGNEPVGISEIEVLGDSEEWSAEGTAVTTADLSSCFNADGFSYQNNRPDGDFDGMGNTYPAELASTTPRYDGVPFQLGSLYDGAKNVIKSSGQTIPLPQGNYSGIWFLGASTGGSQKGTFRVNYTDGTYTASNMTVSGWENNQSGYVAQSFAYRHSPETDDYGATSNTHVYAIKLEEGKTVESLRLPDKSNIGIFAVSLLGAGGTFKAPAKQYAPPEAEDVEKPELYPAAAMVDLNDAFNVDGFSYDVNRGDGSFDGSGYTYCADAVEALLDKDGIFLYKNAVPFRFGDFTDGKDNVIGASGQTVVLPKGGYSAIWFLGAATGSKTSGKFRINYTDGSSSGVNVTQENWGGSSAADNWGADAPNRAIMVPRHKTGSGEDGEYKIYAYSIPVETGKYVDSITLPGNDKMHIIAMTLAEAFPAGNISISSSHAGDNAVAEEGDIVTLTFEVDSAYVEMRQYTPEVFIAGKKVEATGSTAAGKTVYAAKYQVTGQETAGSKLSISIGGTVTEDGEIHDLTPVTETTDGSKVTIKEVELEKIDIVALCTKDGKTDIISSTTYWGNESITKEEMYRFVFDGDFDTFIDGNDKNATLTFTIASGGVRVRRVRLYPRKNPNDVGGYVARLEGAYLEGSNDGSSWVTITDTLDTAGSKEECWYTVNAWNQYRDKTFTYLRIAGIANLNTSEIEIYGEYDGGYDPADEIVVVPEDGTLYAGGSLQFSASGGTGSNYTWSLSGNTSTETKIDENGKLSASVDEAAEKLLVRVTDGKMRAEAVVRVRSDFLTEGGYLDVSGMYRNGIVKFDSSGTSTWNNGIAGNDGENGPNTDKTYLPVWMFDGNDATFPNIEDKDAANPAWLLVDLGGNNAWALEKAALTAPDINDYGRANNVEIYGSNDNVSWTRILAVGENTFTGKNQTKEVDSTDKETKYRYFKVTNTKTWYGNLAELKLYPVIEKEPEYTITAKVVPGEEDGSKGGKVVSNGKAVKTLTVSENDSVTLKAVAGAGYLFEKWTAEDGTVVSGDPVFTVENVREDGTYTAHFKQSLRLSPSETAVTRGTGAVFTAFLDGEDETKTVKLGADLLEWTVEGSSITPSAGEEDTQESGSGMEDTEESDQDREDSGDSSTRMEDAKETDQDEEDSGDSSAGMEDVKETDQNQEDADGAAIGEVDISGSENDGKNIAEINAMAGTIETAGTSVNKLDDREVHSNVREEDALEASVDDGSDGEAGSNDRESGEAGDGHENTEQIGTDNEDSNETGSGETDDGNTAETGKEEEGGSEADDGNTAETGKEEEGGNEADDGNTAGSGKDEEGDNESGDGNTAETGRDEETGSGEEDTANSTADHTAGETYITADGILHICESEEAEKLTVKVSLKSDPRLTATAEISVTAKAVFEVTVSASPADGGRVEGEGSIEEGGSVTISAAAKEGYQFLYWMEDEEVMARSEECMISNIMEPRHFVAYFGADMTELEAVIAEAEALKESDFDPEDYAVFKEALEYARTVMNDSGSSLEAVNEATVKLRAAIKTLTEEKPDSGMDEARIELNSLITEAKALKEPEYTTESYAILKEALGKAESILLDPAASLETVNQAREMLKAAMDSLEKAGGDGSGGEEEGDYGEILPEDVPADGIIPDGLWIAGIAAEGYAYTGSAVKPEVRVYDGRTLLREKTDYTISYKNNVKAADATVSAKVPTITVTGKGNYTGKETAVYTILPLDIGADAFGADDMAIAYTGKSQKPVPVLFWNTRSLKKNTDYTVTYYDTDRNESASVKEEGTYYIQLTGKGNFKGTREINLSVTADLKLISKVNVAKIKDQQYTGDQIRPAITAKYGKTALTEGTDYDVVYIRNTEIGTAYAVLTGMGDYTGTKRISFKITGLPVSKAKVSTPAAQIYGGVDLKPAMQLSVQSNGEERILTEGEDYTVSWQKNRNAGTATAVFTGKGGFVGTLKRTFKIKAFQINEDSENRFSVTMEKECVPFVKGGAKPKLNVTFRKDDGTVQKLSEGTDYTVSYKYNTSVNDGSNEAKVPTAVIRGKGNFTGLKEVRYKVEAQKLDELTLTAADKSYQNKRNIFPTKITVTDLDGKTLKAGKDYDSRTITYTYKNDTVLSDGTVCTAGATVEKTDIIPAGTWIVVTVSAAGNGNYIGNVSGEYRITKANISSAKVSIPKQTYTGKAITLDETQITVRVKGVQLTPDQYQIIPGSYKNNVKKGTASVSIRGLGDYGGTKTVKFSIKAKGFLWWGKSGEYYGRNDH